MRKYFPTDYKGPILPPYQTSHRYHKKKKKYSHTGVFHDD